MSPSENNGIDSHRRSLGRRDKSAIPSQSNTYGKAFEFLEERKLQRRKHPRGPDPVDLYVGKQVRARRILLGLSQEKLAEGLGITFQQVQKYERGSNRIRASRLYNTAHLLDVPITYFFEGVEKGVACQQPEGLITAADPQSAFPDDLLRRKETLSLLRHYYSINDSGLRQRFSELLMAMTRDAPS